MTHAYHRLDQTASSALAVQLSDELLSASRQALAAGLYELAYHALAGALHGAESGGDGERLRAIEAEAGRQQGVVDTEATEHRLSRRGGRRHGHVGWYDALALQAKAAGTAVRSASAFERAVAEREAVRALQRPADGGAEPGTAG
jgi:hypothetical protein